MFEFKTSLHAIPTTTLYLYYLILAVIYLLFFRDVKFSYLSLVIMVLFNQGFIILLDPLNRPSKIIFTVLSLLILFSGRMYRYTKEYSTTLLAFLPFSLLFFLNYVFYDNPLLWASFQYIKYFIPIVLFFGIRGLCLTADGYDYYGKLIIKLLWFQIFFSVVKIVLIGFRENITGSIADTGGGIGVGYASLGFVLYWIMKDRKISGSDWWFVILLLLIPVASNKRAIWFFYPILFGLILFKNTNRLRLRNVLLVTVALPLIVYMGFRINPSLNPDRKIWGSFDPGFAVQYALSYSGVSEEKLSNDLAQGRWGAANAIVSYVATNPFYSESLIGNPVDRTGEVDADRFWAEDYGMQEKTGISSIGRMLITMGWPATLLIVIAFVSMTFVIKDSRVRNIMLFILLWDLIFYSGSFINSTYQSILYVLVIHIIAGKCQGKAGCSSLFPANPSLEVSNRDQRAVVGL